MRQIMMGVFCFLTIVTVGQERSEVIGETEGKLRVHANQDQARELVQDTVYHPLYGDECALEVVHVGIQSLWGRISGMNGFGDLEKGQELEFTGTGDFKVVGVIVYFVEPKIVGNGNVNCKIYDTDPQTGAPDRLRGFSDGKRMSEIVSPDSVGPLPTIFTFEGGVDVLPETSKFIASVDFSTLYGSRDTLVIWQTTFECGDGGDTWELHNDGITWVNMSSSLSWESNFDLYMGAIVEFEQTVSTQEVARLGDLSLFKISPNPVEDQLVIKFGIDQSSDVLVQCYDLDGKQLYEHKMSGLSKGVSNHIIATHEWPSGNYLVSVRSSTGHLAQQFSKL